MKPPHKLITYLISFLRKVCKYPKKGIYELFFVYFFYIHKFFILIKLQLLIGILPKNSKVGRVRSETLCLVTCAAYGCLSIKSN
jgi:hypothetical protein